MENQPGKWETDVLRVVGASIGSKIKIILAGRCDSSDACYPPDDVGQRRDGADDSCRSIDPPDPHALSIDEENVSGSVNCKCCVREIDAGSSSQTAISRIAT